MNRRIVLILLLLPLVSQTPLAANECWNGTIVEVDGVTHVRNAATSTCPPKVYDLVPRWTLSSDDESGFIFGAIVDAVLHPSGVLCLLDNTLCCVHRIDTNGSLLGQLGRSGEGPGEFLFPTGIFVTEEGDLGVVDATKNAVQFVSLEGKPKGSWTLSVDGYDRTSLLRVNVHDGRYIVGCELTSWEREGARDHVFAGVFETDGTLLAELGRKTVDRPDAAEMVFDEVASEPTIILGTHPNGSIYTTTAYEAYSYEIRNAAGNITHLVERQQDPLRRSEEQISDLNAYWKGLYKAFDNVEVKLSPYERTVYAVHAIEADRLWIETSAGWYNRISDVALRYDATDTSGRFLHEVHLRGQLDAVADAAFLIGGALVVISAGASVALTSMGVDTQGEEHEVAVPSVTMFDIRPL